MRKLLTLGIMLASIGAFANGGTSKSKEKVQAEGDCEIYLPNGTIVVCTKCDCYQILVRLLDPTDNVSEPVTIKPPTLEPTPRFGEMDLGN